ncbi:MAG: hypothetical protein D6712_04905 [Chloroflexi bacterium]|nr:MAG: hypothetical protein D6712_04905 [Chloroflexota bacterium]
MARLIGLIMILGLSIGVIAQDDGQTIAAAERAYILGDYEQAIALYEQVIAQGATDGVLYYNLGSAYYMAEDYGRALVNYLRAQMVMPRDGDLQQAIARIRSERLDLQGDDSELLEGLAAITLSSTTQDELEGGTFALWTLWFMLLTVFIIYRQQAWRNVLLTGLGIVGVIAAIGLVLTTSRWYVETYTPQAVVTAKESSVMSGPDVDYLEHFVLHSGAEVRIHDVEDGWALVRLPDGRRGWIQVADIAAVSPEIDQAIRQ